jgi:hypothetical protein
MFGREGGSACGSQADRWISGPETGRVKYVALGSSAGRWKKTGAPVDCWEEGQSGSEPGAAGPGAGSPSRPPGQVEVREEGMKATEPLAQSG